MRIPDELVDRIKQTADIVDVVGDFVSLKRRGSNYQACCPFHNEKTPSFNVNPVRQIYKCFGCGKAGDAVRFVMDIENIGFTEALRYLAKKYGIEVQEQETTPEELLRQNERESLFIVLNFAKTYYQELLRTHEDGQSIGRSYFRERGFTDPTIDAFELGYSLDQWDALLQTAQQRGYNTDLLEKAGLIITKEDATGGKRKVFDRFRGRVMFPIHNVSGRVIAFGARILANNKNHAGGASDAASGSSAGAPAAPKYLNSPETEVYHKSNVLYGIYQAKQAIRQEEVCYLTEGYTDVISLHQAGIKNVVASSGTSLTIEQIRLIARFTPNVTILYDGDAAGVKAALRGLDMVLEEGLNVSIALFPNGDDPDSFVRRVGAEAFKTYLKANTTDFITFKTNTLLRDAGDSPFKQAEVISEIVGSISRIPDPIQRQVFFRKTAQQLNVDEQTLISESNRLLRQQRDRPDRTGGPAERSRPAGPSAPVAHDSTSAEEINALLDSLGADGISPAGADVRAPGETLQSGSKAARSALSYQEEECIRLLLNYGARELEPGITLCHYMLSELEMIQFQTSPFDVMLTLFREAFMLGEVLTFTHFLNRQSPDSTTDEAMQRTAIGLTTVRYELSEGWQKHEIFVPSEEEIKILADSAFSNILRIKKMLAEQQMNLLKQRIAQATDPEESDAFMLEYMHYKRVDVEIAKLLGTVISG